MRIAFLAGPADAREIYRQWKGEDAQAYFGTDYFKQFLQLGEDLDADCRVVTWHGKRETFRLGRFTVDNRPLPGGTGLSYHFNLVHWHLALLPSLRRFRPDVLILTGNQNFWWTLAPLKTLLLPSYHSVLWPKLQRPKLSWRVHRALNRRLILRRSRVVVATSHDIERQVRQLTEAEVILHLPTYSPEQFEQIHPPDLAKPFRVIFVARIEVNKGIVDVLEMARRLPEIGFDICGVGGALDQAKRTAPPNVMFHGFCDQSKLAAVMSGAHAAIVPTRKDLEVGFEMTAAEAILSGRPLITSAVCPALEYLRPASIEVEAESVSEYIEAIQRLSADRPLYDRLSAACEPLKAQFYDRENSWLTAMKKALSRLGLGMASE